MAVFQRATKKKSRLRMAFCAPAKAGKTFTSLRFAMAFAQKTGGRVAVINTESGAIEKYLGLSPDGIPWDFDIITLEDFSPQKYVEMILAAAVERYPVLVIDSLSHAWAGAGGALEMQSKQSLKKGENSFTAWRHITPEHNRLVESIVRSPCHIFATMRTKMEYVMEEEITQDGKKKMVPRKVGLAPIQRSGIEYEFDIIADINDEHVMQIGGTRCPAIDGAVVMKPTAAFIEPIWQWLNDGVEVDPSYYIASEEELANYEKKQALAAKVAEQNAKAAQKPKTASEMLKEKAEAIATIPTESVSESNDESNSATIQEIDSLLTNLGELAGIDVAEAKAGILKKRGAGSFRSLTKEQLAEIRDALAAKVAEARAATEEVPFDAGETGEADSDVSLEDPAASSVSNDSPCGQIQIDEMGRLLQDLAHADANIMDKFKDVLASVGASKRSDLSISQANELINSLKRKNLTLFVDATLRHGWQVATAGK